MKSDLRMTKFQVRQKKNILETHILHKRAAGLIKGKVLSLLVLSVSGGLKYSRAPPLERQYYSKI